MTRFRKLIHEIHRRSLWQVLGIYAVSGWVVYQVVLGLYEGIGLPDWVPATAVALLLVGLPIVLATAFVQEGGAANTGPPMAAADSPVDNDRVARGRAAGAGPALFTWRRAITGGVLSFAVLGLAASGFMGMRAMGIGPAATLVSAGVLEAREPVLLADLDSPSGDSVLASAVTAALRVDLESSPMVSVVEAAQVQEALRRMRRDPGSRLDAGLAMEVALREGIRAVLVGDVTAAGGQYVLTARLVSPDGQALASVRQTATPETVIEAADRLSASLRERLGESFKSIRAGDPLAHVTTGSLDALRKYSQGIRAFDADPSPRKAIGLLGEAVALDSAFAMAWRKLGVAYQFEDPDSMRAALEQAFRHRSRLTDRERYLTEGTYYDIVEADTARGMLAYETLLDIHPDEHTALHNLARLHGMRREFDEAARLYRRAVEAHPYSAGSIRNLARTLAQLKRYDDVDSVLTVYGDRYPEHYQVHQYRAAAAAARFDYATAMEHFDVAYEASDQAIGLWGRISLLLVQGRTAGALRDLREAVREGGEEAVERQLVFSRTLVEAVQMNRPDLGVERLEAYFTDARLHDAPPEQRPYYELAMINMLADRVDRAEEWLGRWRTDRPEQFDPLAGQAETVTLEIAAARGDPDGVIDHYRADAESGCLDCWFQLGRVYEMAGRPDSAIVAYETYIDPPHAPLFRVNTDQWWLPASIQRAAALHDEAGNAAAAARHYAMFVDMWQDADPELEPQVEAARRALDRLTAEGR